MPANNIRTKRLILNLTQSDVAKHMPEGTNAMCLSYIETGKLLPTREGLNALCTFFDCLPTDLYSPERILKEVTEMIQSAQRVKSLIPRCASEKN